MLFLFFFSSSFFSEFPNISFFSQMEPGASPAGRDNSLLQFSACREQIWRVFRKLLLLMVGKCLQILEGTQCKFPLLFAAPRAGAAGGPGAGTVTRAAFASAFCSPEHLLLRYPLCDLSKELGLLTASASGQPCTPASAEAWGFHCLHTWAASAQGARLAECGPH